MRDAGSPGCRRVAGRHRSSATGPARSWAGSARSRRIGGTALARSGARLVRRASERAPRGRARHEYPTQWSADDDDVRMSPGLRLYLDQNYLSGIAKSKPAFRDLAPVLRSAVRRGLVAVMESSVHERESRPRPDLGVLELLRELSRGE